MLEVQGFHPARSGREHLRVYCTACGYPLARADQVLELVGLTSAARRPAGGYSLGMRQRLALATALLGDPRVLVLDEPANGLDPEGVAWMRQTLQDFSRHGGTVLFSSHVLSEVELVADRVVIVARGRLVAEGTPSDLSGHEDVVTLVTDQTDRMLVELTAAGARVVRAGPDRLRVTGMPPVEIARVARLHGVDLHELSTQSAGLEEIFLKLTSDSMSHVVGATEDASELT